MGVEGEEGELETEKVECKQRPEDHDPVRISDFLELVFVFVFVFEFELPMMVLLLLLVVVAPTR